MHKWLMWGIPYTYIRHYLWLMIGILFILPMLTGLKYTELGYIINYLLFDLLFFRWCQRKIAEDEEIERKRNFFGDV